MPYTGTPPEGADHGPSIKNSAAYEAMVRDGMPQGKAAAISNSMVRKGYKKARHRTGRRHGRARGHR